MIQMIQTIGLMFAVYAIVRLVQVPLEMPWPIAKSMETRLGVTDIPDCLSDSLEDLE